MKTYSSLRFLAAAPFLAAALTVSSAEVREEFHQTYELAKTGEVRLDNVNGSVRIAAWDRAEVKVDAIKRGKTQELLEEVKIDVESKPDSIRIKTRYPEGKNKKNPANVDYTLTVPRGCRLEDVGTVNGSVEIAGVHGDVVAKSVNGQVTVNGLSGGAELSTVNGSVKATVRELHRSISLKSVNGSVTVGLPEGGEAEIVATTLNGGISCDFPITIQKSFPVGQKLEGKLGDGGPKVKLTTVNGGIHIDRAKTVSAAGE